MTYVKLVAPLYFMPALLMSSLLLIFVAYIFVETMISAASDRLATWLAALLLLSGND